MFVLTFVVQECSVILLRNVFWYLLKKKHIYVRFWYILKDTPTLALIFNLNRLEVASNLHHPDCTDLKVKKKKILGDHGRGIFTWTRHIDFFFFFLARARMEQHAEARGCTGHGSRSRCSELVHNEHNCMHLSIQSTTGTRFELSLPAEETVEGLKRRLSQKLRVSKDRLALLHKDT